MYLSPGDVIGEYTILEVIGNGGFSVVYRAEDTNLLREVAIKQLNPEAFSEAGTREWFIREARLAASLNHPHIVATYALREHGDSIFLVMEYLSGGDLHTLVSERGPLDRSTMLKVASNVCHALETLHARNVIHRDIKPENILIAQEGQFKLADFGLAHVRQAWHGGLNKASGPQPGTLMYMSPEHALGEKVTARSDLYSLAVVLYEAMTGHYYLEYDLEMEDDVVLLDLIVHADPDKPRFRHASIPEDVDAPLLRALSKDPDERPVSAREFLSEIKGALARAKHVGAASRQRTSASREVVLSPALLEELYSIRAVRDIGKQAHEARERLEKIMSTHATAPEVMTEWGETLVALGNVEEGRAWLERAAKTRPQAALARLALARIYEDVDGDKSAAHRVLVEAIIADPDLVYAMLYDDLAQPLEKSDSYETLLDVFRQAAEEQSNPAVLHNLGLVLALDPRRAAKCLEIFQRVIALDPEFGPAYVGLGSLLIGMGQLEEALPWLEHAPNCAFPELAPYDWLKAKTVYRLPHAHLALALAYAQAGQYENSAIAACTVLDFDPAELEGDAIELLDIYVAAIEAWLAARKHLRGYKLLNQLIPLAAHWADQRIFGLLEVVEQMVPPEYRRNRQWEEALDWLESGCAHLCARAMKTQGQ